MVNTEMAKFTPTTNFAEGFTIGFEDGCVKFEKPDDTAVLWNGIEDMREWLPVEKEDDFALGRLFGFWLAFFGEPITQEKARCMMT